MRAEFIMGYDERRQDQCRSGDAGPESRRTAAHDQRPHSDDRKDPANEQSEAPKLSLSRAQIPSSNLCLWQRLLIRLFEQCERD